MDYELGGALKTWQWYALWAILFLNVTAGIALISEADPLAQEVSGRRDRRREPGEHHLGRQRRRTVPLGLALGRHRPQVGLYDDVPVAGGPVLPHTGLGASYFLLAVLTIIIVSCYGGGFGTMPAFNADYFGSANVGKIYGLMLTAWGFGGVLGPLLISRVVDATGSYAGAFYIIAGIMLVSSIIPFIVRPPKRGGRAGAPSGAEARA